MVVRMKRSILSFQNTSSTTNTIKSYMKQKVHIETRFTHAFKALCSYAQCSHSKLINDVHDIMSNTKSKLGSEGVLPSPAN